jgi:serine/threonine protein kinase
MTTHPSVAEQRPPSDPAAANVAADAPTVTEAHRAATDAPQLPASVSQSPNQVAATVPAIVGVGSFLGPYKLEKKLGEGGMGAVYKALHLKLDRSVAVKVMSEHFSRNAAAVARFEREMRAVGKLDHPHIVRAMDAGEIGGVHYLAMEFIEGTDLAEYVKRHGVLSVVNACRIIRQAALGLAAAHAAKLIHRDIKPSNLFLTKSGHIKVLDLGLALLGSEVESGKELTAAGQSFGTPDYMAPEQWDDAHNADARTDLYALGCTLFFLLTGRAPFNDDKHRSTTAKLKGHLTEVPSDLKTLRSDVPDDVAALCARLLAKKSEDRPQTAAQLAETLSRVGATSPPSTGAPRAESTSTSVPSTPTEPLTTQPKPLQPSPHAPGFPTFDFPELSSAAPPRKRGVDKSSTPATTLPTGDSTSRKPGGNRWSLITILGLAGGLFAVVAMAGIIIKIRNKDGSTRTIEVENVDPDAEILFTRRSVSEGKPTQPSKPAPPHVVLGDAATKQDTVFVINRRVAEWAQTKKAQLVLEGNELGVVALGQNDSLPKRQFVVRGVVFKGSSDLTSSELESLATLRHLHDWQVSGAPNVDSRVIPLLNRLPGIQNLTLASTGILCSDLSSLEPLAEVRLVSLTAGQVDDDWRFLRKLPNLRQIDLYSVEKPLPDLQGPMQHARLTVLQLVGFPQLDEKHVDRIQSANARITLIESDEAKITVRGKNRMYEAAKGLLEKGATLITIEASGKEQTWNAPPLPEAAYTRIVVAGIPKGMKLTAEDSELFKRLEFYHLNAVGRPDADAFAELLGDFRATATIDLTDSDLTDAGLKSLRKIAGLKGLLVEGTRVSLEGLLAFRKSNPACGVRATELVELPDYEAIADRTGLNESLQQSVLDINRRAAEAAIAQKGRVAIQTKDLSLDWVANHEQLPQAPFVIRGVLLKETNERSNSDLKGLKGLRHVRSWSTWGREIDAESLKLIDDDSPLYDLAIGNNATRTSGVRGFVWLRDLYLFWLDTSQIDDGWECLRGMPNLRRLCISDYGGHWERLEALANHRQLRHVLLSSVNEPPATLIDKLQAANPDLSIFWDKDSQSVQPLGANRLVPAATRLLELGCQLVAYGSDTKLRTLTAAPLPEGSWAGFELSSIPESVTLTADDLALMSRFTLNNFEAMKRKDADALAEALSTHSEAGYFTLTGSDLTDAGLRKLRMAGLRGIVLNGTRVTREGVEAFRKACPAVVIDCDFGHFDPEFESRPLRD